MFRVQAACLKHTIVLFTNLSVGELVQSNAGKFGERIFPDLIEGGEPAGMRIRPGVEGC